MTFQIWLRKEPCWKDFNVQHKVVKCWFPEHKVNYSVMNFIGNFVAHVSNVIGLMTQYVQAEVGDDV